MHGYIGIIMVKMKTDNLNNNLDYIFMTPKKRSNE